MNAYAQKEQKASSEKDKTGIPAQMKAKFERSSGFSFDDVRVHYNSEKPAQLHAHAYTQGSEVFVAPGQEKHLPHELGHVVQQKSNAVKPTGEIGGMPLNDDESMESGADKLAEEAESSEDSSEKPLQAKAKDGGVIQKADLHSEGSYNFNAGFMSSLIGGLGLAGAFGSFMYSKHSERKHKYIDEIEKYADAACDAREEQIALLEKYNNPNGANDPELRGQLKKMTAKIERNYNAAMDKALASGAFDDKAWYERFGAWISKPFRKKHIQRNGANPNNAVQNNAVQNNAAQNNAAQNNAAQNNAAQNIAPQNIAAQNIAAQNIAAQNIAAPNNANQHAANAVGQNDNALIDKVEDLNIKQALIRAKKAFDDRWQVPNPHPPAHLQIGRRPRPNLQHIPPPPPPPPPPPVQPQAQLNPPQQGN